MSTTTGIAVAAEADTDQLDIEFLFLDLTTCQRCRGTDRSLERALDLTRDVLAASGVAVTVNKIHVTSAEKARQHRFVTSPTIRVNGQDVALELRESSCGSESCTDGCGDSIACRVWVYRGQEYTEPPVEMVVQAILRQVYAGPMAGTDAPGSRETYELPDNLARFFAGKDAVPAPAAACCGPAEQQSCCASSEKAECCGDPAGVTTTGSCGCR